MNLPKDLKYSKDHEWIKVEGDVAVIGITDYAQDSLGDIVFLELPDVEAELSQGETFGVVESVKAVSDLVTPVSGKVIETHEHLIDAPETINSDPYGVGWMIKIELSDNSEIEALFDAASYEKFLAEES
jgi:glycine cleavage system H protein